MGRRAICPHEPGRKAGKFGARDHPHDPKDFQFSTFVQPGATLKYAKVGYSHDKWQSTWGMLGNDYVGDCVLAGAGHETMTFAHSGGSTVSITTANALSDYSAITGYDPNNPQTDVGTDPVQAADYRRTTGIVDLNGNRHKIGAYVTLETGNWLQMLQALYMFECVAFCFFVPSSAMRQFGAGERWSYVKDENYEGGHYVPIMGRPGTSVAECVTWGQRQQLTRSFYEHYNMVSLVYISEEMLKNGKSPEGFNLAALTYALGQL